jgi:hypothetical protein
MNRSARIFCFLVLTLAAMVGCSSQPPAKKAETAPDRIQGKAQVLVEVGGGASDAALNAGGPSVYLWEGTKRYRLFLRTATEVVQGREYIAEGVYAQKAIDEIGDPDQGKNGYPLQSSCERVVNMAWSGLAFDVSDGHVSVLRTRVQRYPARPVFLVTRITLVPSDASAEPKKAAEAEEKDIPEVSVAADKQRALLIEGPTVQPAPLWEPAGGTVRCKVIIDKEGKISELETGAQLCETVPWDQFRYKPPVQGGHRNHLRAINAVRRLGGVTGDVMGAGVELTEVTVLCVCALWA